MISATAEYANNLLERTGKNPVNGRHRLININS